MIEHSYLTKKVAVRSSGINRRGVFAIKPIKRDEVIAVWGGHIVTERDFRRLARTSFKNIDDYATRLADEFYLVSSLQGGLEDDDFFNHSCDPNSGIKGQLIMVAMRDIALGEEVTYDYCMTDADFNYTFDCSCGAPGCRGKITTADWKKTQLQKKYKGYFSWHVQEKINRLKGAKREYWRG